MGLLTEAHGRGVFASRPAAGHAGREYYSSDTGVTYRDNGSTWDAQATAAASFATPAIVLGTAAAAGSATTVIRSDATIVAFDATVPSTQAFADAAAAGSAAVAARRDHKHAMPSSPLGLPLGLTGAVSATRYVGGTASVAPTTGTFAIGDFVITAAGGIYICTVAGTPGTWVAVSGGGGSGVTQSFVGYNTIGGTWTAMVSNRIYLKKVTLAATSTFQSIDAHIRGNTDATTGILPLILSDAAGVPDLLIAAGTAGTGSYYFSASASMPTTGRWFSMPIGPTVAAGDYWIGVQAYASVLDLANDGSGSDVYYTTGAAYVSGSHSSFAKTTGTVKNSVRASILS